MIPLSPLVPDDSTFWQWYTLPADSIMKPGMDTLPIAVCECDPYCCDTA
jgi:hypothetical protein